MRTGTVKFFHDEKQYAFIIDDESKTEYYTHKKTFSKGQDRLTGNIEQGKIEKVEYELKEKCGKDRNQTHAVNIKVIN